MKNQSMNSVRQKQALIKKLENAYTTCFDCGKQYGVYSVGCSSVWNGTCNVCDKETRITETRDFGYFITGIRKLKMEILNEKNNSKTKKQQG